MGKFQVPNIKKMCGRYVEFVENQSLLELNYVEMMESTHPCKNKLQSMSLKWDNP
jgi:hypothetical protein